VTATDVNDKISRAPIRPLHCRGSAGVDILVRRPTIPITDDRDLGRLRRGQWLVALLLERNPNLGPRTCVRS